MSYFYIASPYTHPNTLVMDQRFNKVVDFTSWLIDIYRYNVFSPIVHSHPLCRHRSLEPGFDYWAELDRLMIAPAAGLFVFEIEGWKQSKGVAEEIAFAEQIRKPIYFSTRVWPHYDHSI